MPVSAISLPATPGFMSVKFRQKSVVGVGASPFTGEVQIYEHQGQWWEATISYPASIRSKIEPVTAALMRLNGPAGTFLLGDPLAETPLGAAGGTPLVNGADQTGEDLVTDGWPNSTLVLKAGDWMQLGSGATARLYKVLQDVTSDGSGNATLNIWPKLVASSSPADDAALTIANAKGLFRLKQAIEWDINQSVRFGLSFDAFSVTP